MIDEEQIEQAEKAIARYKQLRGRIGKCHILLDTLTKKEVGVIKIYVSEMGRTGDEHDFEVPTIKVHLVSAISRAVDLYKSQQDSLEIGGEPHDGE